MVINKIAEYKELSISNITFHRAIHNRRTIWNQTD